MVIPKGSGRILSVNRNNRLCGGLPCFVPKGLHAKVKDGVGVEEFF